MTSVASLSEVGKVAANFFVASCGCTLKYHPSWPRHKTSSVEIQMVDYGRVMASTPTDSRLIQYLHSNQHYRTTEEDEDESSVHGAQIW